MAGYMFLRFGDDPAKVAEVVRSLGWHCTSALNQLSTNKSLPPHVDGGTVRCLFLAKSGYAKLGIASGKIPGDAAFQAAMAARTIELDDRPRSEWEQGHWRDEAPDAMLLVADSSDDRITAALQLAQGWLNGTAVSVLFEERGHQQFRTFVPGAKAEGVEHFGYVDGRSQPLVLKEDVDNEPHANWKAAFPPSQFIVADPNGRTDHSAGSYFVFRKLEQDVKGFNAAEDKLGEELFGSAASEGEKDRAGAMVVGRFENGSPLVSFDSDGAGARNPVRNDFNYDGDPDGERCPFHSHIRKVNPREDGFRDPIMIRRGMTYGAQRPMNADRSEFDDAGHEPVHESGLLFMAYMASIEGQFELTQHSWADNPDFRRPGTGSDPIIGQVNADGQELRTYQDGPGAQKKPLPFAQFVTLMGGDYFFAPSLSFLRAVGLP